MRDTSCGQSSLCTAMFTTVLIFVGGVSAYDGYLVVRTGEMIRDFEKNPVGRYLIDRNNGDPASRGQWVLPVRCPEWRPTAAESRLRTRAARSG